MRHPLKLNAKGRGQKERKDFKDKSNGFDADTIEFSREFNIHNLRTGMQFQMNPTHSELAQLSKRFFVESIIKMDVLIETEGISNWYCVKGMSL